MLRVERLQASYGTSQVLFGVDLDVGDGEVVTLLGRNGMGKTTTVRAIMGIVPPLDGQVLFDGRPIHGVAAAPDRAGRARARAPGTPGLPQSHGPGEPRAAARARATAGPSTGCWTCSPASARARQHGATLSGGEQQMLAIARALMTNPRLLVLDEATEGLAPLVRVEIWRCLQELKRAGLSILLIDKNVDALTRIADRITSWKRAASCGPAAPTSYAGKSTSSTATWESSAREHHPPSVTWGPAAQATTPPTTSARRSRRDHHPTRTPADDIGTPRRDSRA